MRTSEKETSESLLRISSSDERDCLLLYDGVADEIGANKKKRKFQDFPTLNIYQFEMENQDYLQRRIN